VQPQDRDRFCGRCGKANPRVDFAPPEDWEVIGDVSPAGDWELVCPNCLSEDEQKT
jgi:hypothetical protein